MLALRVARRQRDGRPHQLVVTGLSRCKSQPLSPDARPPLRVDSWEVTDRDLDEAGITAQFVESRFYTEVDRPRTVLFHCSFVLRQRSLRFAESEVDEGEIER